MVPPKKRLFRRTRAVSDKTDKVAAHRRIRRRVVQVLQVDPAAEVLPHDRELGDPWQMDKDGKNRFDPGEFPKSMRM